MQRLVPILFAALFGLLFLAVALAGGIDSSSATVPPGDVAVIEGAPPGLDTISETELDQEMRQQAAFSGLEAVPKAGEEGYEQLKNEALKALIIAAWLQGQAKELGVHVTEKKIARSLKGSEEAKSLRAAHFTPKTINERLKLQLAMEGIQEKLGDRAVDPTRAEVRGYYEENRAGEESFAEAKAEITAELEQQKRQEVFSEVDYLFPAEWQPRTHCAEGIFLPEYCDGSPTFAHPSAALPACYEADPETPPEDCPALVTQRLPAFPGSVRPWKPEGERLVQRPIPAAARAK